MPTAPRIMVLGPLAFAAGLLVVGERPARPVIYYPSGKVEIGSIVEPSRLRPVTRPGLYGLSQPPAGDAYAVVHDSLVRIDLTTRAIRSVLRPLPATRATDAP